MDSPFQHFAEPPHFSLAGESPGNNNSREEDRPLLAALERYGRAYGARHGLTLAPERLLPFMIARFLEDGPDADRSSLAQIAPAQPVGGTRGA